MEYYLSALGFTMKVRYIGNFVTRAFGVEGEIYSKGSNSLLIKKFKYTGLGPAATFWVGTDGHSPSSNGILLQVKLLRATYVLIQYELGYELSKATLTPFVW